MRVKSIYLFQKASPARYALSSVFRYPGVVFHALLWNFYDGVPALAEELPERLRAMSTGKATADPDDGDRLVSLALREVLCMGAWGFRFIACFTYNIPGQSLYSGIFIHQSR